MPTNGVLVIESTAEGREGEFYELVQRAERMDVTDKHFNRMRPSIAP